MNVTNRIVVNRPQSFIGTDPIKEVDSFKYLGVHVDTRLNFNVQINHLKCKLSQMCGVSFRTSTFVDFQSGKNMYNSFTFSVLRYCIGVRGGNSQCISCCDDLSRFHKKVVFLDKREL